MTIWSDYGFSDRDCLRIEAVDMDSSDSDFDLYIEARKREYYNEFYLYLKENGQDPFNI